jgi:hypothetical protein
METFNTELGKRGLTKSGRPLAVSARRTLEALLKYLGFIFIDFDTTPPLLLITDVGRELATSHTTFPKFRTLREAARQKALIKASPMVKLQMVKLQLTNPIVLENCVNIQVFPFRNTLRLLRDVGYLTFEEIGYILFSMKREDEYSVIKQRILSFRSLSPDRRDAELAAYKQTEEGVLTLVKAPTAGYYASLCVGTGLCEYKKRVLTIRKGKITDVDKIIATFKGVEPFNFADNRRLWIEYYGVPRRLRPPRLVSIRLEE